MGDAIPSPKRAWVTLLTRESYLAGAILLAYSLHKNLSAYPLLILYTPSFPSFILPTLFLECSLTNTILLPTTSLQPEATAGGKLIAERFRDTWTKLRVFELVDWDRLCFLDADMLVFRNMDELFEFELKEGWIAANHVCVCNLDGDEWAPGDWVKENCAYTGLEHPIALSRPCEVPRKGEGKETNSLLNSGIFLFEPNEGLWKDMMRFLERETEMLKGFLFPDQDFLTEFFRGRWRSVGWQYNALKTWRYWHPEMWRDEEVRNLHYIVDKPWNKRVGRDGKAGYLGNDGVTHRWWWEEFERWEAERELGGEMEILALVRAHVAKPLDAEDEEKKNETRKNT